MTIKSDFSLFLQLFFNLQIPLRSLDTIIMIKSLVGHNSFEFTVLFLKKFIFYLKSHDNFVVLTYNLVHRFHLDKNKCTLCLCYLTLYNLTFSYSSHVPLMAVGVWRSKDVVKFGCIKIVMLNRISKLNLVL